MSPRATAGSSGGGAASDTVTPAGIRGRVLASHAGEARSVEPLPVEPSRPGVELRGEQDLLDEPSESRSDCSTTIAISRSWTTGPSSPPRLASVTAAPWMDASGVRSSCETVATKSERICSSLCSSVRSRNA